MCRISGEVTMDKRINLIKRILIFIIFFLWILIILSLNKKNNDSIDKEDIYAKKIPILTFHRLSYSKTKDKYFKDNQWVQSIDVFNEQMKYLYDNGYKTLNLDEFYCWYIGECNFPKKTVVITIDDGNMSTYYLALPIIMRYNFKATAFIVGSRTKESEDYSYDDYEKVFLTKNVIEESKKIYPDFDYQSHTWDLHRIDKNGEKIIYSLTKEQIQQDFDNNKIFGFKYIAYPYGDYNDNLIELAKKNGYKLGLTFKKQDYATRDSLQFEIPRIKINGQSTLETLKQILNY